MEFNGIEHYDVFPGDTIVFWADVSNPPEEVQAAAREIEPWNFSPNCFGLCVNYSFAAKEFYLVTDMGAPSEDLRTIFYTDQNGDKHWFPADIPQELLDQIFDECGKVTARGGIRMSKYQEFDSKIFDVTKIMLDCSLTEGQKSELLKISGEIDAAHREGSLSDAERRRLRADMADCGLELPPDPVEPAKPPRKKAKGRER